ncbi:MAG: PAS domain-containing protein, partial [Bdellovibrionaceae bacterium]|nr:PAS domain-containing protein [Pseudobdellovibrionaceae bacterium]
MYFFCFAAGLVIGCLIRPQVSYQRSHFFWARRRHLDAPSSDAALELIPQMIWFADASGGIEYFSGQWRSYTGVEVERHYGRGWHSVIHPDDLPGLRAERERISRTGREFAFRARIRDRFGRYRWFFIQSNPQKDERGKIVRWVGACTDIHNLIAAESELKLNRDRLQLALAAGRMAAWEVDLMTGEIARSENHDQLYGYDQRQARWTFHDFLAAIHEDDQARVYEEIAHLQDSADGTSYSDEFRVRWADGSIHWLASRAQFHRDADGKAAAIRGVLIDVTSLKEAEESIAAAKVAAEDASRAKSQFLANVSHELRTPLGAILGFQRILREPNIPSEERSQYLEIIERNGTALMQLIDDLLDHSRLEAKRLSIENIQTDLHELIDDVQHIGGMKAEQKGVFVLFSRGPRVPRKIIADPTRVRQVLANLVVNAVKFTERGHVRVDVDICVGRELVFDIRDSGIGIRDEERPTLFTPFRQGD